MKTNLRLLVLDLFESEAVLAKTTRIQSSVSYSSRLDFHNYKAVYQTNNRLFTQFNWLFLSVEAENSFLSHLIQQLTWPKSRADLSEIDVVLRPASIEL